MLTSIIYQNQSRTITLLDLPASIRNAQCLQWDAQGGGQYQFLSAESLEQPYPSLEPKGRKRGKLLEDIPRAEQEYHRRIQALISKSLEEISSVHEHRQWCLPRRTATASSDEIVHKTSKPTAGKTSSEPPIILSSISNVFSSIDEIKNCIVSNPCRLSTQILIDHHTCYIPPRSKFLLSDVIQSLPLQTPLPSDVFHRAFDFILMDPPWQNRSVRHAKAYKTARSRSEQPFLHSLSVLHNHLTATGFVGIWVTNKASIRHLVLGSLDEKGFQLWEEWIWAKTTSSGEPVTALDGLWRRPYEILLLFRRRQKGGKPPTDASELADIRLQATEVPVRVFVAVPDYHSRKPCLKEFIEPLLVDANDYEALEVFARNLTAGWFSWGNEVLKFNWDCQWSSGNG